MKWRDYKGFPNGSVGKESACSAGNAGDLVAIPASGRDENGNPIQYSCLGKHMDTGPGRLESMGHMEMDTAE